MIFITESQIAEEALKINDLILSIYEDFGFPDVHIKFSDRPDTRIGDHALWDKAEMAMMHASTAFKEGQMEESRELSDFAVAVCPKIRSSSAWVKLACKRWMGVRTWRAVRPAAAAIGAMQRN